MKKILLSILTLGGMTFFPSAISAEEASEPVTLYGVKAYYAGEEGASNGVYSIKAEQGAQPKLEWGDGDMMGNGSVAYTDDGMLYILSYLDFFGQIYWSYLLCDFPARDYTYKLSGEGDPDLLKLEPISDTAAAASYDPSTNTIYTVCLSDGTGTRFALKTMNRETAKKTFVADFPKRVYTLSFTADGQMYGIAEDGWLYKIDKNTAELDPVGDTGIIPCHNQSAVIDYKTNIMYWCSYTEDDLGALYTVDITTGQATLLSRFEPSYQIYGLFIEQVAQPDSAPSAVTDLKTSFEGAALTGTIDFTLPETDTHGNPLSGELTYNVLANGEQIATGKGNPGESVSPEISFPTAQSVRFVVTAEKDGEVGIAETHEVWIGMDTPCKVTDLVVTVDEDGMTTTATWDLPERGIHGGFVDHSLVRYRIIRGPEELLVANAHETKSFTETVERDGVYPVLYMVIPYVDDLVGDYVIGNTALAGTHFEPPFKMDLTDGFMSLIFDVYDANNDKATWEYSLEHYVMWCQWPMSDDRKRNDWLVTPSIHLEPGFDYQLKVEIRSQGRWNMDEQEYEDVYAGDFAAYLGTASDPSAMTENIIVSDMVSNLNYHVRDSKKFTVENDGLYNIGLHMTGGQEVRNIYNTFLRSIEVTKAPSSSVAEKLADQFAVETVKGGIFIKNPDLQKVQVFNLDGSLITSTSSPEEIITLQAGIYIVAAGSESKKVVVR